MKNTIPDKFKGDPKLWRQWREDAMDFMDTQTNGIKEYLEAIADRKHLPIDPEFARSYAHLGTKVMGNATEVWRFLKGQTEGEMQTLVKCVDNENGFEAWTSGAPSARADPHGVLAAWLEEVQGHPQHQNHDR